jgi:hypothetical protein
VLRGPGVTPAAKRTQRACRPRDRASKVSHAESTSLSLRKTTSPVLKWPGVGGPPGSKSGACTQGSSRNLGYLVFSTVERRRGRRGRSGPGSRGNVWPRGSEGGRSGGSAERRKRSDARRGARSRSRLIVPMRSGNSPQRTRRMGSGRSDDGACGGTDGGGAARLAAVLAGESPADAILSLAS